MQLTSSNRREVIEDLLDIKIFSTMNNFIKDKIRVIKEDVKTLELKKESLNDKVTMQKDFIEELKSRSEGDILEKKNKIKEVWVDRNGYPYTGRIKAMADAARKSGLKF